MKKLLDFRFIISSVINFLVIILFLFIQTLNPVLAEILVEFWIAVFIEETGVLLVAIVDILVGFFDGQFEISVLEVASLSDEEGQEQPERGKLISRELRGSRFKNLALVVSVLSLSEFPNSLL